MAEYANVLKSGERPFANVRRREGGTYIVECGNSFGFLSKDEFPNYTSAHRAARLWCCLPVD